MELSVLSLFATRIIAGLLVYLALPAAFAQEKSPYVVVLGVAQDGGFPQAGCQKLCCRGRHGGAVEGPSCLALVDPQTSQRWLFECTPEFPRQLAHLNEICSVKEGLGIDGVFLTHAHIGHYAGLLHLGREVIGADNVPVHVMPRMKSFLQENGPWSQLVKLKNIRLQELRSGRTVRLNRRLSVTPILVPHRDEFSETVAYLIAGPQRSVLFLPDIDKWERWETKVEDLIADVDVAYLDATFFDNAELPGRDMAQIPHPFVVESIQRFGALSAGERNKIRFIHLNHTNPALNPRSKAVKRVEEAGMAIAATGERVEL